MAFLLQTLAFVATNKVLTAARSLKRITGKRSVAKTRSLRLKIFLLILRMLKSQLIFFVALRHSTLFGGSAFYQPFLQPRVFCRLAMPKSFLFGMYFSWITAFVCICVCFARRSLLIWMVAEARAESHRTLQNFFTISFSQYTHMQYCAVAHAIASSMHHNYSWHLFVLWGTLAIVGLLLGIQRVTLATCCLDSRSDPEFPKVKRLTKIWSNQLWKKLNRFFPIENKRKETNLC